MIKRLSILTVVILAGLTIMAVLAHFALSSWQRGLAGQRLGQFAEVAEQIRSDVNRKLDEFLADEQNRPYTDYLYYHVPQDNTVEQQQAMVVRSPLTGQIDHGLAYGYFQIQKDGTIVTPNDGIVQRIGGNETNYFIMSQVDTIRQAVREDLLPVLQGSDARRNESTQQPVSQSITNMLEVAASNTTQEIEADVKNLQKRKAPAKALSVPVFQQKGQVQVLEQSRLDYTNTAISNAIPNNRMQQEQGSRVGLATQSSEGQPLVTQNAQQTETEGVVTIRIEPFTPVIIPDTKADNLIFHGQVYLVRHVQLDQDHVIQGFRLNQDRLQQMIQQSAQRFMRDGMGFSLASDKAVDSAYTAILDFGFGDVVLDLIELNPGWISHKALWLRRWYFGALGIVGMVVGLGLFSLWRGAREQMALARQKDDFISAVSHELRTPLTSIRMYAEMLEKGWVKTEQKQGQYHSNIRQESERLSRLIENVLDFSHLQRGRKTFHFDMGDVNECVKQVTNMMSPYAAQQGFSLVTRYAELSSCRFDKDAVMQIVVNLIDNAVKYARSADDKTIVVRTGIDKDYFVIEVEDHGPGVPHTQRKKIFEEFYRTEAEATRETSGTGLGLALVKRFAEAHQGFAQIVQARPQGALFRVGLRRDLKIAVH